MELTELLKEHRLLPYLEGSGAQGICPVIGALCSGGLPLLCVGAGNDEIYESVGSAIRLFPTFMLGVQVRDLRGAERAVKAGANFVMSLGYLPEISFYCEKKGIRYIPGSATPTEIMTARNSGHTIQLLPMAAFMGKADYVNCLVSAFPEVSFIVLDTLKGECDNINYLENSRLLACVDRQITKGGLDEIASRAAEWEIKLAKRK